MRKLTLEEQAAIVNQKMESLNCFKSFRDSINVSGQESSVMATVKEEVKKFCEKRIAEINGTSRVRRANKSKRTTKTIDESAKMLEGAASGI